MKKPRGYTIRKRKDCARWELRTKKFGYAGLFISREQAEKFVRIAYGLGVK